MIALVAAALIANSGRGLSNETLLEERLARAIAASASRSEASSSAQSMRADVTASAQQTIIDSGLRPRLVMASLGDVVRTCSPDAPARRTLPCPRTAPALDAIRDLMAVVARLADQDVAPGAANYSLGGPAAVTPPTNPGGGGGSDYRTSN